MQTLKYLSITIIFSALCAFSGFKYAQTSLQKELTEELYYHNALELKQHVAFLKALQEKRYDTSARWHENFMDTNLVVLETYGQDSSGKYKRQVTNIISEAKKYKDLKDKEDREAATVTPPPSDAPASNATLPVSQTSEQLLVQITGPTR